MSSTIPQIVRGRTVLDFASGSGLVGDRGGQGRRRVGRRCRHRSVHGSGNRPQRRCERRRRCDSTADDLIGTDHGWDVVLAGDVFYDQAFADRLVPWFAALAGRGAMVLVGDPGRSYLPKERLEPLAEYQIAVTRALEDAEVKRTTVWRFA